MEDNTNDSGSAVDGLLNDDFDISMSLDPTAIHTAGGSAEIDQDPTAVAARKRRPMVKLTGEKLVSPKGLPYVVKNAPKRIHISKRRSSYENLCNVLQFYQLWAHEVFPKAKFKDFVGLCEGLGKTDKLLREYRIGLLQDEMRIRTVGDDGQHPEHGSGGGGGGEAEEQTFTTQGLADADGLAEQHIISSADNDLTHRASELRSTPTQVQSGLFVRDEYANFDDDEDDDGLYTAPRHRKATVLRDDEDQAHDSDARSQQDGFFRELSLENHRTRYDGPPDNNSDNNNNNDDDEDDEDLELLREAEQTLNTQPLDDYDSNAKVAWAPKSKTDGEASHNKDKHSAGEEDEQLLLMKELYSTTAQSHGQEDQDDEDELEVMRNLGM